MRLAQQQGYFSTINFKPVTEFFQADGDRAIAESAVTQLGADVTAGHDHLVMARTSTVKRAEEVFELYRDLGASHRPRLIHSGLGAAERRDVLAAIRSRESRIVVCVNMLGEPPIRSVFLDHDAPAALDVRLNGASVSKKDVFAVQLAIWNRGNQSIRPENVLEPVLFIPDEGTEVVDATILRKTRDVCGILTSVDSKSRGAQITWRILEPGDGAIVQLVLVGDQRCRVTGNGTIEGGGRPHYVQVAVRKNSESAQLWSNSQDLSSLLFAIGFMTLLGWGTLVMVFKEIPKALRQTGWRRVRKTAEGVFLALVAGALAALVGLFLVDQAYNAYRVPSALLARSGS
jgi:hypothetical protein